ncbi:MAG: transaldolase [Thermoanaerobaculales bacterium]|jgi:transaldolase|nr:transaldolase [Thermoanaerobaculales bacterium]
MNPLKALWEDHRQAPWLDYIERDLLTGGGLERLVRDDGVRGVTSNPSIFKAAITGSGSYDADIDGFLAAHPGASTGELYEALAIRDIQLAADILAPVYRESGRTDGFVSLEVSPHLAHDSAGTEAEAVRLWGAVDRPNLMVKVPATAAGIPAIEALIAAGVNVNATLMFSLTDYDAVAGAFLRGLERRDDPSGVASVASFFVSRVDSKVDAALERIGSDEALGLRGRAAIANSRLAYRRFLDLFHGPAFASLAARGAQVQRPLWASTSTKNPAYADTLYVEELVGPETVNTLPTATLEAYRDHGRPRSRVAGSFAEDAALLERLGGLGIALDAITAELQTEGVAAFADAFDSLLAALDRKRAARAAAAG